MNIEASIKGIQYQIFFSEELQEVDFSVFDINTAPSACILTDKRAKFAISKWVSPKRSRSYPFERVYNTLAFSKKITVMPIIKDEGAAGDRDFIQWDTISLMSLLDVYVIFAYYVKAEKTGNKITNQQFDNKYVLSKIKEIEKYHSSALHWNLNELNVKFRPILTKAKSAYSKIEENTGVKLHNFAGIDKFCDKISDDVASFMSFSREKAEHAQAREMATIQPKERLSTLSKAKITITNYLGGKYFLTVDEVAAQSGKISLIEGKHSKSAVLPSKSDIRDGLLKMILYANLSETFANKKKVKSEAVLSLTSSRLDGEITSSSSKKSIQEFCEINHLTATQIETILLLFNEAKSNHFTIKIHHAQ